MSATQAPTVRPIGVAHSAVKQPGDDCWSGLVSALDPHPFKPESTASVEHFPHLEIVFIFDRVAPNLVQTTARHPRERRDWPKVGIFAQGAKDRPNRIGTTVCKIDRVDGLRISVHELEAIDGTPVFGHQAVCARICTARTVRQAAWSKELMASYFKPNQ